MSRPACLSGRQLKQRHHRKCPPTHTDTHMRQEAIAIAVAVTVNVPVA